MKPRRAGRIAFVLTAPILGAALVWAQSYPQKKCECGANPPGPPAAREMKPYTGAPDDLRPYSNFTVPYFEHYTKTVEYNGAARDIPSPELDKLKEIRIGFLGPVIDHPDQVRGRHMLDGAAMAIEEANTAGGYGGKPFVLMVHNDQAIWGASSNEIVKMVYDDEDWAMLGSISGDSTHIALRVSLKAELPIVNTAATDPTIPETIIPWSLTAIQDDREQSYTLARRIYTDLGLGRVAILRINDRYGRFGVLKFRDASRRLGHPVQIEQKYMQGATDFARQLRVIQDSRVDGIVLWGDAGPAGNILKQMRSMGMKQRVFGSFRVYGEELLQNAGDAAEGLEFVYPYDPTTKAEPWTAFHQRFHKQYKYAPDSFAALGYDGMKILLDGVCRGGLNRGHIRDALAGLEAWHGVTGDMVFDTNSKNIAPLYLGTIKNGQAEFRKYGMDKPPTAGGGSAAAQARQPYARVGESGVDYTGPRPADLAADGPVLIGVFGPKADKLVAAPEMARLVEGTRYRLVGIDSEQAWGKASNELVRVVEDSQALALIATERKASHLALQLGNKVGMPVIATTDDRALTSTNIPWIFRLPASAQPADAIRCVMEAAAKAGMNRDSVRRELAGVRFDATGEPRRR